MNNIYIIPTATKEYLITYLSKNKYVDSLLFLDLITSKKQTYSRNPLYEEQFHLDIEGITNISIDIKPITVLNNKGETFSTLSISIKIKST